VRAYQFGIGEVGDDLAHAPLSGRGREVLFLTKNTREHNGQKLGAAAITFEQGSDFGHAWSAEF